VSGQIVRLGQGQPGQQVVTIEPSKKVEINPAHKGILMRDAKTGQFAPFKTKA
jgi:hypothetical protein